MEAFTITPMFRAHVEIDDSSPRADLLKFCDAVERLGYLKKYENVMLDETSAGPAWRAYYVIQCDKRATLAQFLRRLPRIARGARVTLIDCEATP